MRPIAALLTLVGALAVAAPAEAKQLTRYDVGGGLAGRYDRLVIAADGRAHQTGDSGDHRFTVRSRQLRALKRELRAAHFGMLKRRYEPGGRVFDGTTQTIRYRGRAVSVSSGADIPARLSRVLSRIARLLR